MNICIVTVFDSYNSGSFWQAYILSKIFEKNDCQVFFLKRNFFENAKLKMGRFCKLIGVYIFNGYKKYKKQLCIYKSFNSIQKKFKIISNGKMVDIDIVVFGSDTLWNIDSKYFRNNYKLFFGGKFPNYNQVTYGISAANTSIDNIKKLDNIKKYISHFNYISVRDDNTYNIAYELTKKHIFKVCDPTMLYTKEQYAKLVDEDVTEKYIFLYLFKDLDINEQEKLKEFAYKNNLKIFSGIKSNTYSDICINNSPQNFLNYIYNAEYVITDTFHGTMFSLNLNKKFVVLNRNKKKVNDLLCFYSLENRLSQNEEKSFIKILETDIDYTNVNRKINLMRKESFDYIKMIMESTNGNKE